MGGYEEKLVTATQNNTGEELKILYAISMLCMAQCLLPLPIHPLPMKRWNARRKAMGKCKSACCISEIYGVYVL